MSHNKEFYWTECPRCPQQWHIGYGRRVTGRPEALLDTATQERVKTFARLSGDVTVQAVDVVERLQPSRPSCQVTRRCVVVNFNERRFSTLDSLHSITNRCHNRSLWLAADIRPTRRHWHRQRRLSSAMKGAAAETIQVPGAPLSSSIAVSFAAEITSHYSFVRTSRSCLLGWRKNGDEAAAISDDSWHTCTCACAKWCGRRSS